jgi:hypothetical protein
MSYNFGIEMLADEVIDDSKWRRKRKRRKSETKVPSNYEGSTRGVNR